MAIGTLAAVGLGVAGVGSVLGAKSASKASKKASNIAAQTAADNNALTRDIYGQNKEMLSPYAQQGNTASYALNSFLGLTPTQQPQQQQQPNAMSQFAPMGMIGEGFDSPFGGRFGVPLSQGYGPEQSGPMAQVAQTQQQPMTNGRDAFRSFIDNSDYAFQFGEGANRVNSGYAGQGTLQSGAAMKGLEDYRQNLQQGYRGEFLNLLGNQQGVGLSGASALAGVGQNMVNTISANNNSAGTAAANAALVKGQNNPFANALSTIGGGLFGLGK